MTYEIKHNYNFNSSEIYFNGKPSEAIREALKALKMRFHGQKKCWYGFASEKTIINAISEATPEEEKTDTAIRTDGYLGGGAIYGSKSRLNLFGQDLKKAIAEDIKKSGIKGVSLSMKKGNLTATIKTAPEDLKTPEEFRETFEIQPSYNWISYFDENKNRKEIPTKKYFAMTAEEQKDIKEKAAEFKYYKEAESENWLNHYYLDRYGVFSDTGMKRIKTVQKIIEAYRYDESNLMVDYFNTNFYYDIITKPGK